MYDFVIVAPGQGIQRAGMLDPWIEDSPRAADLVAAWSVASDFDLLAASRDEEALEDTSVAQPVIVAAALLSFEQLTNSTPLDPGRLLFAGHSVGELSTAAAAGCIAPATAVSLARSRGLAMAEACRSGRSGMMAVMPSRRNGAPDSTIVAAITAAGLTVANWNGSNQFVAAGPRPELDAFAEALPAGLRVAPLEVAGAFHTEAMADAMSSFAVAVSASTFHEPQSALLGNSDGRLIGSSENLRRRLIAQITSPVRWDLCLETLASVCGADTRVVELAPAGPLTRITERSYPAITTVALADPSDINRLQALAGCP